jgi:hypothetical protein
MYNYLPLIEDIFQSCDPWYFVTNCIGYKEIWHVIYGLIRGMYVNQFISNFYRNFQKPKVIYFQKYNKYWNLFLIFDAEFKRFSLDWDSFSTTNVWWYNKFHIYWCIDQILQWQNYYIVCAKFLIPQDLVD